MKVLIVDKKRVLQLKKGATDSIEVVAQRIRDKGHTVIIKNQPSIASLEKYLMDGICPTPDGCRVEPDGTCEHGYPSWMLLLMVI